MAKQSVLMRKFKGGIDTMVRLNLIESLQPPKPTDPETGLPTDYRSAPYRHIEELIEMFREYAGETPPRRPDDIHEITNLKERLRRLTDKLSRAKRVNKKLRQQLA